MILPGAWRLPASGLLLVGALGLASCGSDSGSATVSQSPGAASSSASTEPSEENEPTSEETEKEESIPPGTPACSQVWRDGNTLPRSYDGCREAGEFVKAEGMGCSSGQRLVRHDDLFYAVLGGTIHEASRPLLKNSDYLSTVRRCRA